MVAIAMGFVNVQFERIFGAVLLSFTVAVSYSFIDLWNKVNIIFK